MSYYKHTGLLALSVILAQLLVTSAEAQTCKAIHADLVETLTLEGCDPGLSYCFIGSVNGNHGLRGVTHFKDDSTATGPVTALEGFISYSGSFQYRTGHGTLDVRETGVTNTSTGLPQSGAVTAYQQILGGTGEYEGATGFLFVNGRNTDGVIETRVFGELCLSK